VKKPVFNIIIAFVVLAVGFVFQIKGSRFVFGLCSGIFVTLLNSFFIYLNVKSVAEGKNALLRYMLELLFIRMPLIAALIFLFIVILKAGLLGFAAGIAIGFSYGMFRVAKPDNFVTEKVTQ
jgi:hypothetical protein